MLTARHFGLLEEARIHQEIRPDRLAQPGDSSISLGMSAAA
jgi:hypothetical protein